MLTGPRTLGRLLKLRIDKSSDKYAIGWIENDEVKNITFKQYKNQLEILVCGLNKLGLNIGDKVAILAQTCKEWHYFDTSIMVSRAVSVPIYPSYPPHEVNQIFLHSDSSIIIVENDKQMEKIIPYLKDWTNLRLIISLIDLSEDTLKKFRNSYSYYSMKDLVRIGTEELKTQPDFFETSIKSGLPEEVATIVYTSGTTGEPKGVVITQHAFTTMLINIDKTIQGAFNHQDKTLVFLPLSHVLGRCDSFLPLIFGCQSVYAESLEKIIPNLQIVRPTIMIAVPRIFEKIYAKVMDQVNLGNVVEKQVFKLAIRSAEKYFEKVDQDLSPGSSDILEYKLAQKIVFDKIYNQFGGKVRYFVSGGAPLSKQIITFLKYANLTILEGYGLTETIAPCCLNPLSKQVAGTVGRPMGDVQISFATDGEILIKTDAMLKEYYKNPEATQESIKDGWLYSGDIGEFTPEGYLRITDRKKDLIKTSGGKYIAPQ
jgi:long-chain acyl-CoA synthetase